MRMIPGCYLLWTLGCFLSMDPRLFLSMDLFTSPQDEENLLAALLCRIEEPAGILTYYYEQAA